MAEKRVKASPRGAPITEPAPAPPVRPCALDDAPVGSKLVVMRGYSSGREVVLMTPNGPLPLAANDLGYSLMEGAKVSKQADDRYVAELLGGSSDKPSRTTSTAREAFALFNAYFG